jgi:hypothetical protein
MIKKSTSLLLAISFFLPVFIIPLSVSANTSRAEIIKVFRRYLELNTEFVNSVREDSPMHKYYDEYRSKAETYAENVFNPILKDAVKIVCEKKDVHVINEYFKVIINTTNSADEYPSFVLGEMFICHPGLFREQYEKLSDGEKSIIYDALEWGFENVTWKKEDKIPNYKKTKRILDSLRSKNG